MMYDIPPPQWIPDPRLGGYSCSRQQVDAVFEANLYRHMLWADKMGFVVMDMDGLLWWQKSTGVLEARIAARQTNDPA